MPALAAGQVDGIFTDLPPFRLRNNYRGPWQLLSSCWRRFEMPRTSVRPACTRRDAPAVPHVREQPSELSRSIGNRFDACAVAALASCTGRVRTSARALLAARDSASKLRAAAAVSENSLTRASSARRARRETPAPPGVYGHVVPGFLRDAIDQLKLGDPAPFVTPLLPAAENTVEVPEGGQEHSPDSQSLNWRALLDSNQWPSASETDALSN